MVGWPYSQVQGQYWVPSQYDSCRAPEALARAHSVKRVDDGEEPSNQRMRNYKPPKGVITHELSKAAREDMAEKAQMDAEKASARRRLEELEGLEPIPVQPNSRYVDVRRDPNAPLKSCLKKPSPPQSQQPTPTSQGHPPSFQPPAHIRQNSAPTGYFSEPEVIGNPRRMKAHRSQTHPPGKLPHSTQIPSQLGGERQRQNSIHVPFNPANYVKPAYKTVPMKNEAIALSWPLIDFDARRHKGGPSLYFDAAFDPDLRGYEVKVMRQGERSASLITPEEIRMLVSPHAILQDMTLYHPKFPHWKVNVHSSKGIRCLDVFREIYNTFAQPLSQEEIVQFGSRFIESCEHAFNQRCEDSPGLPPVTKSKGICRIDLLRGERIFKGLVPGQKPQTWEIQLEGINRYR